MFIYSQSRKKALVFVMKGCLKRQKVPEQASELDWSSYTDAPWLRPLRLLLRKTLLMGSTQTVPHLKKITSQLCRDDCYRRRGNTEAEAPYLRFTCFLRRFLWTRRVFVKVETVRLLKYLTRATAELYVKSNVVRQKITAWRKECAFPIAN